jgi:beta-galactosidase
MKFNIGFCLALSLPLLIPLPPASGEEIHLGGERRIRLTDGWRFFKGDAAGAEQPSFDDSSWRRLNLPHDWAIEGPFDPKYSPSSGGLPFFGVGWYRKTFTLSGGTRNRYVSIEFDGAMANSTVWLNGNLLGGRPYGYIGFSFDLTPYLNPPGSPNLLAVKLAPEDRSSRWYPGAGIYRNVWLDVTGPIHVARWGTYVTTQVLPDGAQVSVRTEIRNRAPAAAKIVLQHTLLDPAGTPVTSQRDAADLPSSAVQQVNSRLTVAKPEIWDIGHPSLYTLVTEILLDGKPVDRYTTPFGIRTIAFDNAKGFLLNGRAVKLQGVCLHHDLGALGAAVNRRATERQLQIMKSMGANAIRTSHNPPSPELLEFCDRLGLLVMDEAFDVWRRPKIPNDYSKHFDQWSERDVRDMARRDRNHPSVIMWSIGNEIGEQGSPQGAEIAGRLSRFFHEEDPTRPTTAGFNNHWAAIKNGLAAKVGVVGFNYKPWDYAAVLKDHPGWILVGAETSSVVSSRGVYHLPLEKYEKHDSLQISSYDIISPPWAYLPDPEFEAQEKNTSVLGEFVWTGFDYLGEPTPFHMGRGQSTGKDWPSRSSYFGIVDLAGFPKDRYYLYQSLWTRAPMVHLLPHWNWQGREGQNIPVMVYTNADEAELIVNGKSLGRKKRWSEPVELPVGPNISKDGKYKSKYRLLWQVPYQPGSIKAVAYNAGKVVASKEIKTAGAPARLKLLPDRARIAADGEDLAFVTVRVEDKAGNLCPEAMNSIQFTVSGPAAIAAVDNGNPATTEPFQAGARKAFNGLALLIVRSEKGRGGDVRLTAASEGLIEARAILNVR